MKLTREIKTAILVIASILLFIFGYSFLKGRDLFDKYETFYVEYDNVEGLSNAAPVTLNGLTIGKIKSIKINKSTGKLIVELQLKTDFPFSKSSVATIYEPGLIKGKQIAIYPNLNDKEPAVEGQFLKGEVTLGLTADLAGKLGPVKDKVEQMLDNFNQLVSGLNNVLDENGQQDIKKSLAELSKTIEQFHKASASINSILDTNKSQINGVVTNFNKISGDFSKISDSLNKADLAKTVRNLNQTLAKVDDIMNDLNSGKGTVGKLLKDKALYDNLQASSKELELLLQDVRLAPTRYINISLFGKKNKPYVAHVNDTVSKK